MTRNRILSLLVCAALLAGLLAGCTSTSGGSSASASGDAASSESIPASTAQADTGKLTPNLDEDENSIFSHPEHRSRLCPLPRLGPRRFGLLAEIGHRSSFPAGLGGERQPRHALHRRHSGRLHHMVQ